MSLTRITRGMLDTGAVIVPDNISATGVANSSTYLRGDGQWAAFSAISDQALFTTSSVKFAAITATNVVATTIHSTTVYPGNIIFSDGSNLNSASNLTPSWENIQHKNDSLGPTTVAIGANQQSGYALINSVLIGSREAGYSVQLNDVINIGYDANSIGNYAIAIGTGAQDNQDDSSIAIGHQAYSYGARTIAIGRLAGSANSDPVSNDKISIGSEAGRNYSGRSQDFAGESISIGNKAGRSYAAGNSIILNATDAELNARSSGFFVKPINNNTSTQAIYYNPSTGELTYGPAAGTTGGNPFDQSLNTSNDVLFHRVTATIFQAGSISSGNIVSTGTISTDRLAQVTGAPYNGILVYNNLVPAPAGPSYSYLPQVTLGTPSNPWRHLYVSSNSISFVDTTNTETFTTSTLSLQTGTLYINNQPLVDQSVTTASAPTFSAVVATTAVTINNYTLPAADGNTGNVVATDGAGQLNFYASTFMTWMNFDGGSAASIYSIADPSIEGGAANSNYQGFNIDAGYAAYA